MVQPLATTFWAPSGAMTQEVQDVIDVGCLDELDCPTKYCFNQLSNAWRLHTPTNLRSGEDGENSNSPSKLRMATTLSCRCPVGRYNITEAARCRGSTAGGRLLPLRWDVISCGGVSGTGAMGFPTRITSLN